MNKSFVVYKLFFCGTLIYVGQSGNVAKRLLDHEQYKVFDRGGDVLQYTMLSALR